MITFKVWLRRHAVKLLVLFVGVLLPLYGFGVLAEDVISKEVFPFDQALLTFAHSHASASLDRIMILFTRAGSALILVPVDAAVFALLLHRAERSRAVFWLAATAGAALLNLLAKHSFERLRPALWVSLLPEHTFSFPSGHAMQSMAVCVSVVALTWHSAWRWPAVGFGLIFVPMVGASRVYLGVHYPSDILAGWTASLAWVIGLASVFRIVSRARATPEVAAVA